MNLDVIKVPAPKEVDKVNCILLDAEKTILIDPGPNTEKAFNAVIDGLKRNNVKPEDIESILITHPHSDHFGNAHRMKQVSEAEICIHREAAEIVENFQSYKRKQIEFFSDYFRRMGVREEEIEQALEEGLPNTYSTVLEVDRNLEDGETIDLGSETLKCVKVEGHAKGSMCFILNEKELAFTGDFMLPEITPNPMLMLPEGDSKPPFSLILYLNSLHSFKSYSMKGYGGHEDLIEDVGERATKIIKHHEERKEEIFDEIKGGVTAFQVMESFFGELNKDQYYLGMAEIISHIQLLEKEKRVERKEKNGKLVFSRT